MNTAVLTGLPRVRRDLRLIERGWYTTHRSGVCVRCVTPYRPGALVAVDYPVGRVGECCAGVAAC